MCEETYLKSRHKSSHSILWQNKSFKYKHCVNNGLCLKKIHLEFWNVGIWNVLRRKWIYREAYPQSIKIQLCHAWVAGVGLGVSRTTSDAAPQLPRSLWSADNSWGLAESRGQPVPHMCPNHAMIFGWGLEKQCVGFKSPHTLKMYFRHKGTALLDIRRADEGSREARLLIQMVLLRTSAELLATHPAMSSLYSSILSNFKSQAT